MRWLFFIAGVGYAFAQREALHIGNGVTSPKIIRQVEPKYSREGERERVQGTVILGMVVSVTGEPTQIELISPLGYGLDEEAFRALRKWQFVPGRKDGEPVPVYAVVELNFRFHGTWADTGEERRRAAFNLALNNLAKADPKFKEIGMKSMQKLAAEKYPRALALLGFYYCTGKNVDRDEARGLQLLDDAMRKDDSFALAELGRRYFVADGVPQDKDKGIAMLKKGSVLGSAQAQRELGVLYESGNGVERDATRAKRQFRLCAAGGDASCQYRLSKLMLVDGALERDRIQAIAWLDLAAETVPQLAEEAKTIKSSLTPKQIEWMEGLKPQLLRSPNVK